MSVLLPTWLSRSVWAQWVRHRREIKHPLTPTSCDQQIADLGKWRDAGHDPVEIINASLRSGWQGLFEPRPARAVQSRPSRLTTPPPDTDYGSI